MAYAHKKLVQSIFTLTLTLFAFSVIINAEVTPEAECSLNPELREEEDNNPKTDDYPELTDERLDQMVEVLIIGLLMDDPELLNDSDEIREQIITKRLSDRFEKLNYQIIPPLNRSVKAQFQEIEKKETASNFCELQNAIKNLESIEEGLNKLIGSCYPLAAILKYFDKYEALEEVRENIAFYKDILDDISKQLIVHKKFKKDLESATSTFNIAYTRLYCYLSELW
ncbi:MAG TPA: hypothetical protein DIU37_02700 [Opitutae bacterium]|nr:hypothetical protein [Opitutae bacterium]